MIMERIKIDLDYWEDARFPIKTDKVNQKKAEEDLYVAMRKYGYDDEYIEQFFKKDPMEYTLDDEIFDIERWKEEELAILDNGGIYYEDLEEDYDDDDDDDYEDDEIFDIEHWKEE